MKNSREICRNYEIPYYSRTTKDVFNAVLCLIKKPGNPAYLRSPKKGTRQLREPKMRRGSHWNRTLSRTRRAERRGSTFSERSVISLSQHVDAHSYWREECPNGDKRRYDGTRIPIIRAPWIFQWTVLMVRSDGLRDSNKAGNNGELYFTTYERMKYFQMWRTILSWDGCMRQNWLFIKL